MLKESAITALILVVIHQGMKSKFLGQKLSNKLLFYL